MRFSFRPVFAIDERSPANYLVCDRLVGKVLGSLNLGGNIVPVENLAESLQVAAKAGAKRLLLPMASVGDIPTVPEELFAKFQPSFSSAKTVCFFSISNCWPPCEHSPLNTT